MPSPDATFRPLELGISPVEAAARLASLPGFVFLDSAHPSPGAISILASHPDTILEGHLADRAKLEAALNARKRDTVDHALPAGAAIGAIAFDGSFQFGFYENLLIYLHDSDSWLAFGDPVLPAPELPIRNRPQVDFRPEMDPADYCQRVQRAQEWIAAGDIYQVCLAHRFSSDFAGDPWPLYEALRHYSPAPQAAFLTLGKQTILSASPESFLHLSGRRIVTRPIKGTRPRQADADGDERSAYDLITSPKEVAELVMITDLERNDLGRVCEYGTVKVTDLLRLERFEQVFHLVSTVEGHLRPGISHLDALAACFPGGSISGAPKIRALEIIAALEPVPRGLYTGNVGFFGFNGESRFNIAIRTVEITEQSATFHVGAGIVADSIPDREWQETFDKASGILLAASRAESAATTAQPPVVLPTPAARVTANVPPPL